MAFEDLFGLIGGGPAAAPQERNPFERLFNPDNPSGSAVGGLLGTIGSALGMPTNRERMGALSGQVMQELMAAHGQGLDPQRAIMQVVQSPSGQRLMGSGDPNAMNVFGDFLKAIQPPPPVQVSPGTTTLDPYTHKPTMTAPTTDQQNFDAFIKRGGVTAEKAAKIAELHALPADQRPGLLERTVDEGVAAGDYSPEVGRAVKSGMLDMTLVKDPFGRNLGVAVTNRPQALSGNQRVSQAFLPFPQQQTGLPTAMGEAERGHRAGNINMIGGLGWSAGAQSMAANLIQGWDPAWQSDLTTAQSAAEARIGELRASMLSVGQASSRLKLEAEAQADRLPKAGLFGTAPPKAVEQMEQILNWVEQQQDAANRVMTNPQQSPESQNKAQAEFNALDRVRRALPLREDLQAAKEALREGKGVTGTDRLKDLLGLASRAEQDTAAQMGVQQGKRTRADVENRAMDVIAKMDLDEVRQAWQMQQLTPTLRNALKRRWEQLQERGGSQAPASR